jgi:hypothetical protein
VDWGTVNAGIAVVGTLVGWFVDGAGGAGETGEGWLADAGAFVIARRSARSISST